jgi:serine/threonine protein phosphatase PrpC
MPDKENSPNLVWVAHALSIDHKPDNPEERERIEISGGRVSSMQERDPVTGVQYPVGPARVYLRFENYPGLAMSRSMGDTIAHSVGVSSEPEIYKHDIIYEDKFIIIASDGIWEFISSEEAVRTVVPFWHQNNPNAACEALQKKAVSNWTSEETIIDDITCIVIFLNRPNYLV